MAPATGTAILILLVFVLPGFVALLLRERSYVVRGEETPFERLLNALFYSALIYALVISGGFLLGLDKHDLVDFYEGRKELGEILAAALLVALLMPAAIAQAGVRWRASERVRPAVLSALGVSVGHSVRSGWNQMFGQGGTALIRVTLKDERVIGGYYGPGSLAGYSEHTQDLYISQRWELDDDAWFVQPAPSTLGVWLPHDNIASVELYEVPPEPESRAQDTGQTEVH
jgi:hypothetical protein